MARGIGGILFDKDGTLFDFRATWEPWAKALLDEVSGGDTARAEALGDAVGFDLAAGRFRPGSIAIAGTPEDVASRLVPHLPGATLAGLVTRINALAAVAPQAEAVPLVPFLTGLRARGLALGVATNDAEGPARAHLAGAGVEDAFDFIAGYDSGHGAKPGPGMALAFAGAVGVDPGRIAMIGDSTHDLHCARAAGMVAVAVLTGPAERAALEPLADAVLDSIAGLEAWLDA
ncbi:HAD family hydrolase [Anianabacter salinae]|uniref:HAD family hydrolase n=1 Tax=Anianabacter salinae TaxID=2851023 RepID=UPI00225DE49B|nr:HAD family hydrolase [Anianabacter salinae]MBV0911718.1 HAD family hydrolase [Anianabacter salinae]